MNSNNPGRNVAAPSFLGNSGAAPHPIAGTAATNTAASTSLPTTHPQPHLLSQSQPPQTQGGSHFPGHFQLSQPQTQLLAQSQFSQPHSHVQSIPQHQQQPPPRQPQAHPASQSHGSSGSSAAAAATPASTAKRSGQRPPTRPAGSSNTNQSSAFKTMELTPAPLRRKRSLPEKDKRIPDKVAAVLPESAVYTQLLELEGQVDAALSRKKIDIQEAVRSPRCVQKTLRVYVYNTFSNQNRIDTEKKMAEEPSWSLRITGRILEDGRDPVLAGVSQGLNPSYPKFSAFFKKITIYLDQGFYPDNHLIIWDPARSPAQQDGFEVKRKGDKEFTVVMRLAMNYIPEKFVVSTALSKVLGIEFDTRPRIIAALWQYVKSRKLQSPNDPSFFMCDPSLQRVFGEEKIKFSTILQKISQQLSQPQPIHVEHKIKLSGNCPVGTTCYDVLVDVPLPLEKDMSAYLASIERHKEIDVLDEVICSSMKKIHEHRRRRAFFLGFSQSPAEFINALIASQSKDLKLIAGDASQDEEKERRSEFYKQPWAEDAVIRYLNRKSARSDIPGST
ncbi:SWI/SNF complex component SNF12 homolog [Arachis stenosperma]|uniref:SWI/SNF complex component SNF12 homolog n=1 Tax=Arachis stenosperma TaxID=217475 RepID=UPI0025AC6451|nr:SWI/SNF complex component SNF12 homolog [Arachis stenosperma]XP_057743582.1 SWI/SNF complex component SNF12 homolog [Arachis stenosperma]